MKRLNRNDGVIGWVLATAGYSDKRPGISGGYHGFRQDDLSREAVGDQIESGGAGPETPIFITGDGSNLGAETVGSYQYFAASQMAGTGPDHLQAVSDRHAGGMRGHVLVGLFPRKPDALH